MRITGLCTKCWRVRMVRCTGSSLATMAARGGNVPHGICDDCDEKDRARTRRR